MAHLLLHQYIFQCLYNWWIWDDKHCTTQHTSVFCYWLYFLLFFITAWVFDPPQILMNALTQQLAPMENAPTMKAPFPAHVTKDSSSFMENLAKVITFLLCALCLVLISLMWVSPKGPKSNAMCLWHWEVSWGLCPLMSSLWDRSSAAGYKLPEYPINTNSIITAKS